MEYLMPEFKKGSFLRKEMLDSLHSNQWDILNAIYGNYGDGIVSGMDIVISDETFIISKGIFRSASNTYLIKDSLKTEILYGDYYLCLRIKEEYVQSGVEVKIEAYSEECVDKIISADGFACIPIAKYNRGKGSKLKEITSIGDSFGSLINRLSRLVAKKSVEGGSTISDFYLRMYANEMLAKKNIKMKDIVFSMDALNGITSKYIIDNYFEASLSNEELLRKMNDNLKKAADSSTSDTTKEVIQPKNKTVMEVI